MSQDNLEKAGIEFKSGFREVLYRRDTSDLSVLKQVYEQREYDLSRLRRAQEILNLLDRHKALGERPLIVDAGANIGASAVYFANTYENSRIVAIEPEDSNFSLLIRNTAGLDVTCHKAALASLAGTAKVVDQGKGNWGFQTEIVESSSSELPTITINDILNTELQGNLFPFIAKIDIEGGEANTFDQNLEWIDRFPLLIVELHDWIMPRQATSRPFISAMATRDRDFIVSGELVFSVRWNLDS